MTENNVSNVTTKTLWTPSQNQIESTRLWAFMQWLNAQTGSNHQDYQSLYAWSVDSAPQFWSLFWDFSEVVGDKGIQGADSDEAILQNGADMEQALWFPNAALNYAENLLRHSHELADAPAMIFRAENQVAYEISHAELLTQVASVAEWLRELGVTKGDRVAALLPNMPETVVAMLAATSLGAIWTSTSPDFGTESVIERFGQTTPKVLFSVDGYFYNGKSIDISAKVEQVAAKLSGLEQVVIIPLLNRETASSPAVKSQDTTAKISAWSALLETTAAVDAMRFTPCGFNDPLFILYSSGTTGKPKCITHKVGGVLLQHLKEHQLHTDIRQGDRFFYFTTCGWMMWNWLVSGLASGATLMLYDGSPFYPSGQTLWDYVDAESITQFGTSAKYIDALKKHDILPKTSHELKHLRTICSTGSVLAPESFEFVYESIKSDVCLSSISGGTDIVSCFILGCPILPVVSGECQCRGLGLDVAVYDQGGNAVVAEKGELVCQSTFPAQPAGFWGDDSGEKYHNAYFAEFPNVWYHGDYVKLTETGGVVVYGRSDATLNPGGVRIGTAEIYRYVEQLDEITESIVIGQDWQNDVRVVLFVVLAEGVELDTELKNRIKASIKSHCTPRHVPAKIIAVAEIPRTKSGKIVELAVRDMVHNRPIKNAHALANPEALEQFRNIPELN